MAAPDSAARLRADSLAPPAADSLPADSIVADTMAADSLLPALDQAAGDTTARKGPSPTGAMVKSLLLPGLGQISLGRKLTAAVFVAFEGATLAMVIKSQGELNDARAASGGEETPLVMEKSRKREDWLVLMGLNHVFVGLEAYVSAHLWDFPGDIQIRALPQGGVHAAASIPLRFP